MSIFNLFKSFSPKEPETQTKCELLLKSKSIPQEKLSHILKNVIVPAGYDLQFIMDDTCLSTHDDDGNRIITPKIEYCDKCIRDVAVLERVGADVAKYLADNDATVDHKCFIVISRSMTEPYDTLMLRYCVRIASKYRIFTNDNTKSVIGDKQRMATVINSITPHLYINGKPIVQTTESFILAGGFYHKEDDRCYSHVSLYLDIPFVDAYTKILRLN